MKTMMEKDVAVKKYAYPRDAYIKYYLARLAGTPDFDVLVE